MSTHARLNIILAAMYMRTHGCRDTMDVVPQLRTHPKVNHGVGEAEDATYPGTADLATAFVPPLRNPLDEDRPALVYDGANAYFSLALTRKVNQCSS